MVEALAGDPDMAWQQVAASMDPRDLQVRKCQSFPVADNMSAQNSKNRHEKDYLKQSQAIKEETDHMDSTSEVLKMSPLKNEINRRLSFNNYKQHWQFPRQRLQSYTLSDPQAIQIRHCDSKSNKGGNNSNKSRF